MSLNIIVCIKSVVLHKPAAKIIRQPEYCELNPFDRPALEIALKLKKEHGAHVTALSMGPDFASFVLSEAMALGADRGVLISDPALAGSDTIITSLTLAEGIKKLSPFDLVVFGTRTADSDTGQVGPQTAVLLDRPLVTWANAIEVSGDKLIVDRIADSMSEKFEMEMPAVLTIHPGALEPSVAGLAGIETAFSDQKVEILRLKDLGLEPEMVGETGSPTRVASMKKVKKDRTCTFIEGTVDEQADILVKQLVDEGLIG